MLFMTCLLIQRITKAITNANKMNRKAANSAAMTWSNLPLFLFIQILDKSARLELTNESILHDRIDLDRANFWVSLRQDLRQAYQALAFGIGHFFKQLGKKLVGVFKHLVVANAEIFCHQFFRERFVRLKATDAFHRSRE